MKMRERKNSRTNVGLPFSDSSLLYMLHQNKSLQLHFSWGKGGGFFLNSYTLVKSLEQAELCKAVLRLIRQESAL